METSKIEKALYVIDLKIADTIRNNNSRKYCELRDEIIGLNNEKREIYNSNQEVIDKVLSTYLSDVVK